SKIIMVYNMGWFDTLKMAYRVQNTARIPKTEEEYNRATYLMKYRYHRQKMDEFNRDFVEQKVARYTRSLSGYPTRIYGGKYTFHKLMANRAKSKMEKRRVSTRTKEPLFSPPNGYEEYETARYKELKQAGHTGYWDGY
ncbi:MAG: hypothetical protein EBW42_08585, partial [Rhodobacterales bacterium]|nr:hypothetical protein [Rhodobacterales bacterium]